eukprot:1246032-Heterocapsa_arctica.AAC.1
MVAERCSAPKEDIFWARAGYWVVAMPEDTKPQPSNKTSMSSRTVRKPKQGVGDNKVPSTIQS